MIRRRRLVLAGLASAILWPLHVRAQSGQSVPRIAVAVWGSQALDENRLVALRAGLADLGWKVGAILNIADRLFYETRNELAELALKYGMASIGGSSEFADAGALVAYAPDSNSGWRRMASLVDRILKGAVPAKIPVEQLNVYEFVVNLRTAKALKLKLPASFLLQATRVIE